MDNKLPSTDFLKSQAKRLRVDLISLGYPVAHAATLEMVAHQWGARDWNTLNAMAGESKQSWTPGDAVIDANGTSPRKTSNGQPHLVLHPYRNHTGPDSHRN